MMKTTSIFSIFSMLLLLAACGGNTKENAESAPVDDDAFYSTQPVHSGLYNAVSYDITGGSNPRKGKFDGRLFITLSPETSALYVFENGNRTKIDYKVVLEKPFEKGDSGVYRTVDVNGLPVTIAPNSLDYILSFEKNKAKVEIGFESKPKSTGTAFEILERMNEAIQKNKQQ